MPRRVTEAEKLDTTINVPITSGLKKRLRDLAKKQTGAVKPKPTQLARGLLEKAVAAEERKVG